MGRPIPGTGKPKEGPGLFGVWAAEVASIRDSGIMIRVPKLTGQGLNGPVSIVAGLEVEPGDLVWVLPVDGRRDLFLIIAQR